MDRNGVLAAIYDPVNLVLNVTVIGGIPTSTIKHDENGAWQGCFDRNTNTIRVVFV